MVTVPMASFMPDFEEMCRSIGGSKTFAKMDVCNAYWKIPLSEESRAIMSIQRPIGAFTPTRIFQGSRDAEKFPISNR